jgi:hypothetical protein
MQTYICLLLQTVDFGDHELYTWYYSPYPPPFATCRHLFVCPYTLKYFRKRRQLDAHIARMPLLDRHPPGELLYLSPDPAVFPPGTISTKDSPKITSVSDPRVCQLLLFYLFSSVVSTSLLT